MVHVTTFLAYSKDHVFVLKLTCVPHIVMMLSFQNLLYCSLILHEHVTSVTVSHFVFFVFYSSIKIRENKRKMKENKIETKSIIFNSDSFVYKRTYLIGENLSYLYQTEMSLFNLDIIT